MIKDITTTFPPSAALSTTDRKMSSTLFFAPDNDFQINDHIAEELSPENDMLNSGTFNSLVKQVDNPSNLSLSDNHYKTIRNNKQPNSDSDSAQSSNLVGILPASYIDSINESEMTLMVGRR